MLPKDLRDVLAQIETQTDKILRLTPEDSKLFVETCMGDSPPNETMLRAAENYRKSLDERYKNISAIIAEKCDKSWLNSLQTEDDVLEECVRLCKEVEDKRSE